ncbi:MAG: hypothetical protein AAF762_05400 [Pseudomonadota bacterium]
MVRLAGALIRAILVVLLLATPSLLMPGVRPDTTQVVILIGIFAAALTFMEYSSDYPGIVEFRDAPPFNRIRFASLFITVALLALLARGMYAPSNVTAFVSQLGRMIGDVIDFPYSPVRLVVLMLPPDADVTHVQLVRNSAGISYLISLLTLAVFVIMQRVRRWPAQNGAFNVWINLPTFDPTAGGDVVERLERDARFNVALGFLLPFLVPAVTKSATSLFGAVSLENPHTLIWTVAAWAFLPASLFMRGIAMGRIATMISEKRMKSAGGSDGQEALVTV